MIQEISEKKYIYVKDFLCENRYFFELYFPRTAVS